MFLFCFLCSSFFIYIYPAIKYCLSKESVQQTANASPIINLLTPKTIQKAQVLPLIVTYSRTLPNIKEIIWNHWSIWKSNKSLEKTFSIELVIAFHKNKTLKEVNEGNTIQKDNVLLYDQCVVYKTHINFLANKMDWCLQFSTKWTPKVILSSIF